MHYQPPTQASTLIYWILAALLAITLAATFHVDDHSDDWRASGNLQDAIAADARAQRIEKTARYKCGAQAAWQETPHGTIVCTTKYGKKTGEVIDLASIQ